MVSNREHMDLREQVVDLRERVAKIEGQLAAPAQVYDATRPSLSVGEVVHHGGPWCYVGMKDGTTERVKGKVAAEKLAGEQT